MNLSNSKSVEILLVEDSPSDAALTIEALKAGKIANFLAMKAIPHLADTLLIIGKK